MPATRPAGPTDSATVFASSPGPQPTSSTRCPGARLSRARIRAFRPAVNSARRRMSFAPRVPGFPAGPRSVAGRDGSTAGWTCIGRFPSFSINGGTHSGELGQKSCDVLEHDPESVDGDLPALDRLSESDLAGACLALRVED